MKKLLLFTLLLFACSCSSVQNISYFQDLSEGSTNQLSESPAITVRPDDKISIVVNSKDPMLMQLVNLVEANVRVSGGASSGNSGVSGYTVDSSGEIDFPVLGKVHVEGKNREEISALIKERLISEEIVKDPIVTVEFVNLAVSVMGEVSSPGRYSIDKDRYTIIDALTMAGDLTIYGKRDNVTVLRVVDDKQLTYQMNLLDAQSLLQSPAYYLAQNDIIYIEPNDMKARQSTVNGNNVRSTSFWFSLFSLVLTITLLFVN